MRILTLLALLFATHSVFATAKVDRIEPSNWWVGMKKRDFQILVYGPNIGSSNVTITYPSVTLKKVVKAENANYLFLYVNVAKVAKPGNIIIKFTSGKDTETIEYPLKARAASTGAKGFNAADVLYLITPDRFANGDLTNDNWDNVRVNRESPNARHGGDMAGIAARLDYLKDLGITTVWLNPIQENKMRGGSYHGYAITDFYKIDPRFGSNEEFKELTKSTHQKGMKMVMDMVFNHCGSSHWWMQDLPFRDWINNEGVFLQTNHSTVSIMDLHASPSDRNTFLNGWFTRGMPDLNQTNVHLATYLIQNSIWWIEYAQIDGIRQDTYSYMDFDFLARWNKEVNEEYPNFTIVGETWYKKKTSSAWWQAKSLLSKKNPDLEMPMDFSLTFITQNAFDSKANNNYLSDIYEDIAQDFLYPNPYHVLTFLDNHDLSRFRKNDEINLDRYKQGLAFLLTMRGIPQLFYGTEILMTGTKEEGDGKLRKDFPGGWPTDTTDQFKAAGRTEVQNEAWNFLKKILQWRKTNEAVTKGNMMHFVPTDGIYVYARIKDGNTVMVILNGTAKEQSLKMDRFKDVTEGFTIGKDVISERNISINEPLIVPANGQYILELSNL